jgi:basic membrane lipoprotein Med (substrate-binding protein (PBP1-ABC) superfamily)
MMKLTRRGFLVAGTATVLLATQRAAQAAPLKVAGIHTVPVENPWNSRLHAAMLAADKRGDIKYVFSENISNTDYERAMREYAEQGIQLIVGESYGVEPAARKAAADYPKTAFLMGSSGKPAGSNFSVFGTWNHEAAYLTGMIAGKMTKTDKLGAVGGYPIPEVNRLINAFRLGASQVNPKCTYLVGFIGTWFDPPKAKEAAIAQIDSGADILFGERIGTADAAKEKGIKSIGSLIDFSPQYPGTVIANAVWNFGPIVDHAIADVAAGNIKAADYSEFSFMKYGGNALVYDAKLVPEDVAAPALAKQKEIADGKFTVPIDDNEPK